ncbi:HNH/ENDO VII family nuclease [Deinococcus sp.]|uniref:HNH/ENDO VII family nuclease n=1 Tax=Deinococcus sp. TaxID=47478 RepID=UPI003CC626CD
MKPGDQLKEADGGTGTVLNVLTVQQTQQMYNLTVEVGHTFYVGEQGWLVHNANCLNLKFWNEPVDFQGRSVYQRDDLFDPNFIDLNDVLQRTNLQRMRAGNAPIGYDGKSVNLHHLTQDEPGAIAEVGGVFHSDNTGTLHGFPPGGQSFRNDPALDRQFSNWAARYWRAQARDFGNGLR